MRLLACLLVAAAPGHAIDLALTHGLVKIFRDTVPGELPPPGLLTCRGGTVGLQVAVRAGDQAVHDLQVEPLKLTLGQQTLTIPRTAIFREAYVPVTVPSGNVWTTPRDWPDPLIPHDLVRERGLPAQQTTAFWIDVAVPLEMPAATWRGTVRVWADGRSSERSVELQVADVALPLERHVRANVAVYFEDILLSYANEHWRAAGEPDWTNDTPAYVRVKEQLYELLLQHRFCAYDLPVPMTSPEADRWYADPRVHSIRLPWLDDQGSRRTRDGLARATERGVRDKLYYYAADEPVAAAYPNVVAAAAAFREVAEDVPFAVTVGPVEPLFGAVDIWAPNLADFVGMGYLDPARLAARQIAGETAWWYTCCVPLAPYPTWLVDDDAVAPLASIWMMARYRWTGCVYSMAHGWSPDPYASVASFNQTNGDGLLLYPGQPFGTDQPFPSLRLKLLRDGLQDYELLLLLADAVDSAARRQGWPGPAGAEVVESLTRRVVHSPHAFERDPAVVLKARETAIAELLAARRDDWLCTDRDGVLEGRARPGTEFSVDGLLTTAGDDGRWQLRLAPGQDAIRLRVGRPAQTFTRVLHDRWRPPTPEPPYAQVGWAETALTNETAAGSPAWGKASPVTLANGAKVRFAADPEALWVQVVDGEQGIVVLNPGRTHDTAYTFVFTNEPRRAVRRTLTGRDDAFAPDWHATGEPGRLLAQIPWRAVGRKPSLGEIWGATAIGYVADGRAFWHDHHGDLRELPELRF